MAHLTTSQIVQLKIIKRHCQHFKIKKMFAGNTKTKFNDNLTRTIFIIILLLEVPYHSIQKSNELVLRIQKCTFESIPRIH